MTMVLGLRTLNLSCSKLTKFEKGEEIEAAYSVANDTDFHLRLRHHPNGLTIQQKSN